MVQESMSRSRLAAISKRVARPAQWNAVTREAIKSGRVGKAVRNGRGLELQATVA
jgi:hypothetical protein